MIIGMDWMQQTVDSVKLHPCGLVFKSLFDFVEANLEDGVTEYIKRAAYVAMIMVYNQWTEEGKRVMSIPTADSDKILLDNVLVFYHEFFKVLGKEMQTPLPQHGPQDIAIDLMPNTDPPSGKLYPMSQDKLALLRDYIEEMVMSGKIRPGKGTARSPIFFVKEKTGKMRLVVDYRGLNAITTKDKYPIPLMTTLMEQVQECTWFTKLDLKKGLNLIYVKEGDKWKTAFKTRYGLYKYTVMPFGLTNATSVFQRYVNHVLKDLTDRGMVPYIDDILIYAKSEKELVELTKQLLRKLEDNRLCLNVMKCVFHSCEVESVGYTIGSKEVRMSDDKVKHIVAWNAPRSVNEVQQFWGSANFYRRFIRSSSAISPPLTQLMKKGKIWNWTTECQEAFELLKKCFVEAPLLVNYHLDKPLIIETNASDLAKGAVLSQYEEGDKKWHPVAFYSKKFSPAELNYDVHDKEMVVIVNYMSEWCHMLVDCPRWVVVYTDHRNLEDFQHTKILDRCQAR